MKVANTIYGMDSMIVEFQKEAKVLILQLDEILKGVEADGSKSTDLETYGQIVDRIMGGAKSIAEVFALRQLTQVGQCAELCKIVGYKGSQVGADKSLFTVVVAFLMDATDVLSEMVERLSDDDADLLTTLSATFLDRLKWISEKFKTGLRSSVATVADKKAKPVPNGQNEIDDVLKKMGLG